MAQFSDIVSVHLLEKYGGQWLDMTLLLINVIDLQILEMLSYSINLHNTKYIPVGGQIVTGARWSGIIMGDRYCLFLSEKCNTNVKLYSMQPILNLEYDKEVFDQLLENTYMLKLSWKKTVQESIDGQLTN